MRAITLKDLSEMASSIIKLVKVIEKSKDILLTRLKNIFKKRYFVLMTRM